MKSLKLSLLVTGLMVLASSCKKDDFKAEIPDVTAGSTSTLDQWNALAGWSESQHENTTTYFSSIADSAITTAVAQKGLVLVYKKEGNEVKSLPVQDGPVSWHYQVSRGSMRINSENGNGKSLLQLRFSYFVITPEKLKDLEASGRTKLELLGLTYEQAAALLGNPS